MTDGKKKILFVDPDPDLLEECKLLFESRGYYVFTAEDIEEGWKLFQLEKPDAAVVGLMMEEYDRGFVLCHRIKKDNWGKNIPVFLLTAATYTTGFKFSSSTSEEQEWIKCDEVINKPVSVDDLIGKIESYYKKPQIEEKV
jgi:two-component system, OmpR family, response regulator